MQNVICYSYVLILIQASRFILSLAGSQSEDERELTCSEGEAEVSELSLGYQIQPPHCIVTQYLPLYAGSPA